MNDYGLGYEVGMREAARIAESMQQSMPEQMLHMWERSNGYSTTTPSDVAAYIRQLADSYAKGRDRTDNRLNHVETRPGPA